MKSVMKFAAKSIMKSTMKSAVKSVMKSAVKSALNPHEIRNERPLAPEGNPLFFVSRKCFCFKFQQYIKTIISVKVGRGKCVRIKMKTTSHLLL